MPNNLSAKKNLSDASSGDSNSAPEITIAKQLIPLIDFTSLNEDDTNESIENFCQQARTPYGEVAAVCIYPAFVSLAKQLLRNTNISVATVINFPQGNQSLSDCLSAIESAIEAGADELDIVMPYHAYLKGAHDDVFTFLSRCREACGPHIILKIIIETGALKRPEIITNAASLAIKAGAHFVKTSTGKLTPGATLEAAEAILSAIQRHGKNQPNKKHHTVGIKIAGGIRTIEEALAYLSLAKKMMGPDWVSANTFRIGTSRLLTSSSGS